MKQFAAPLAVVALIFAALAWAHLTTSAETLDRIHAVEYGK